MSVTTALALPPARAIDPTRARHGITAAQVVLRWHLQVGNVAIPKTVNRDRMRENLAAAGLAPLDRQDLDVIAALDCGKRIGPHPDEFGGTREP